MVQQIEKQKQEDLRLQEEKKQRNAKMLEQVEKSN